MKVWVVTEETLTTYDEYMPQTWYTCIDKIFDTKDKALAYVRECIKNAINEQAEESENDVKWIIDHVPTDEELLEGTCWYRTVYDTDESYVITEYDVN